MVDVIEIGNAEYHYVYHACSATDTGHVSEDDKTTATCRCTRIIAVRDDATVITRCPHCGERIA